MSEDKKQRHGEWWQHDDGEGPNHRIYVIGENSRGELLFEDVDRNVEKVSDHGWHNWHHIPECTGWDWEPETFPQWIIRKPPNKFSDGGYLLRVSKTDAIHFYENRSRQEFKWNKIKQQCVDKGIWIQCTKEEAEALIAQKPIDPGEGYRLLEPDETIQKDDRYFDSGSWVVPVESVGKTVCEAMAIWPRVIKAVRRRVGKPVSPQPTRTVILKEWLCWDDFQPDTVEIFWNSMQPTEWDHAHETGNTRTVEVPL